MKAVIQIYRAILQNEIHNEIISLYVKVAKSAREVYIMIVNHIWGRLFRPWTCLEQWVVQINSGCLDLGHI